MDQMTGRERIHNILQHKPVDRIGVFEHFWSDAHKKWAKEGHVGETENLMDHFGLDMESCWAFNMVANLDIKPEVVEETEETVLVRDGNSALLRWHKQHQGTPEHVDFLVKDRRGWAEHIKPHLTPDRRRIGFEAFRNAKAHAHEQGRFFAWSGINVFECMHPVCGHEYMLMGMAMDPDWIKDMCATYADMIINLMESLFDEEGLPDGIWFYEDMGFKGRPFMSADMYKEIVQPAPA